MTTDMECLDAAIQALEAAGLAVLFDQTGSTGVTSWDLDRCLKHAAEVGTDRWVGALPGSDGLGGVVWDAAGMLRHHRTGDPVTVVYWSFNHRHPDLAGLLVDVFARHGLAAAWDGGDGCVVLRLGGAR